MSAPSPRETPLPEPKHQNWKRCRVMRASPKYWHHISHLTCVADILSQLSTNPSWVFARETIRDGWGQYVLVDEREREKGFITVRFEE